MANTTKYTQKLAGQRVLVIGGTSGIGFGLAEALIEHDCEVLISSSNPDKIKHSIERLESSYPSRKNRIQAYACNLATPEAPKEIANLFSKVGTLDHVVVTAGDSVQIKPLESWSLSEMQQAGMVRFFGIILVAQHLRKHLKAGPHSSFTITNGSISDKPIKDWSIINGFLTGAEGLMRGLALDLAPLRVNVVSPGPVATELLLSAFRERGEQMAQGFKDASLTGEIGQVKDVVGSYLYLMKDENITGSTIATNGGMYLKQQSV